MKGKEWKWRDIVKVVLQAIGYSMLIGLGVGVLITVGALSVYTIFKTGQQINPTLLLKTLFYPVFIITPTISLILLYLLGLQWMTERLRKSIKYTSVRAYIMMCGAFLLFFVYLIPYSLLFPEEMPYMVGANMVFYLFLFASCILWLIFMIKTAITWLKANFIYLNGGKMPKVYICENNGVKGVVLRRDLDLQRNRAWKSLENHEISTGGNMLLEVRDVMTFIKAEKFDSKKYTGTLEDYEELLRGTICLQEKFIIPFSSEARNWREFRHINLQQAYMKIHESKWRNVAVQNATA